MEAGYRVYQNTSDVIQNFRSFWDRQLQRHGCHYDYQKWSGNWIGKFTLGGVKT